MNDDGMVETLLAEGVPLAEIERLLEVFGGTALYIPKHFDPSNRIAAEAGHSVAYALSRIYGGTQPVIPTGEELRRRAVRARARKLAAEGASHNEIARKCRLHLRQVYRIVAEMDASELPPKEDPRQQMLF